MSIVAPVKQMSILPVLGSEREAEHRRKASNRPNNDLSILTQQRTDSKDCHGEILCGVQYDPSPTRLAQILQLIEEKSIYFPTYIWTDLVTTSNNSFPHYSTH